MSNLTPTQSTAAGCNPTVFVPLTLRHTANAIDLLIPTVPPVTAPTNMKARCFDYLSNSLLEYASVCSSAKLIATFNQFPGSSHNAAFEAGAIASSIKSSFFAVGNLAGLGFCDSHSKLVLNVTLNPATCPSGILYFAFLSLVDPQTTDPTLTLTVMNIEFCLALPQSTISSSSSQKT
jgi:hypothetical protein